MSRSKDSDPNTPLSGKSLSKSRNDRRDNKRLASKGVWKHRRTREEKEEEKENKKENERRSKNQRWDHMQVHLDFHTHKPIAWSI